MSKVHVAAITLYFLLLAMCIGLLLIGDTLSIATRDAVIPLASEGFKVVIGAIVGTISTLLGVKANTQSGQ